MTTPPSYQPPPPPTYEYMIPQRAAWATPGFAQNMAVGWEHSPQGPPVNKKGRKPNAQKKLEEIKDRTEDEEEMSE